MKKFIVTLSVAFKTMCRHLRLRQLQQLYDINTCVCVTSDIPNSVLSVALVLLRVLCIILRFYVKNGIVVQHHFHVNDLIALRVHRNSILPSALRSRLGNNMKNKINLTFNVNKTIRIGSRHKKKYETFIDCGMWSRVQNMRNGILKKGRKKTNCTSYDRHRTDSWILQRSIRKIKLNGKTMVRARTIRNVWTKEKKTYFN